MRSLLDPLLTHTAQTLLSATFLRPQKRWYFRELASHLGVRPSTIQRELNAFAEAGLLSRNQDGNRVYYQPREDCPIFSELSGILIKTVGLVDVLRDALRPLRNRINFAVVHGSIASGDARPDSDVDIMVVGEVGPAQISKAFHGLEVKLGRSINPAIYTPLEFRKKIQEENDFVRTVLASKLLPVQGTLDDLERIAQESEGKAPSDQPRSRPRPSRRGRA